MANDIGAGLNTHLLAQSAVAAIVADRGYPDVLPEKVQLPAYTYTIVSDDPQHHMDGLAGLSQARVQFDFYADTRREANLLDETVRIAISGQTGTMGDEEVRTCHAQTAFRGTDQPVDGSDKWRYFTTRDYLVNYVQSTT